VFVTYNHSNLDCVSSLIVDGDNILDLSVCMTPNKNVTEQGMKMCSTLIKKQGLYQKAKNHNLDLLSPSILKVEQKERIRKSVFDYPVESHENPLCIPSAIARMSTEQLVTSAYNDYSEPCRVYTDASKINDGPPTVGYAILDSDERIIQFHGEKINKSLSISKAEYQAGSMGLQKAIELGIDSITWISDNVDAQSAFVSNKTCSLDIDTENIDYIKSSFDKLSIRDIAGRTNVLSDSIVSDIRNDRIGSQLTYKSPYLEST